MRGPNGRGFLSGTFRVRPDSFFIFQNFIFQNSFYFFLEFRLLLSSERMAQATWAFAELPGISWMTP